MTWWMILGLVVVAVLLLIPVVMIGWLILGSVSSFIDQRRITARRVTAAVEGYGDFTTTDDESWDGEVDGLDVSVVSAGAPPSPGLVHAAVAAFEAHVAQAEDHVREQDEMWTMLGPGRAERFGIDYRGADEFTVTLSHSEDENGWFFVVFRDGAPDWGGWED